MNQFKALVNILDLIPDNIEDILKKADMFENKIMLAGTLVGTYQTEAQTWVNDIFPKVPQYVDDIFTSINNGLKDSSIYQKIKDQDLTPLFTLPQGFDPEDFSQLEQLISQKMTELKTYLAPLDIKKQDIIFSGIEDILTDLMDIPEDLDLSNESLTEAFQQMKVKQLQEKAMTLLEEVLGIPLTPEHPSGNTPGTNPPENPDKNPPSKETAGKQPQTPPSNQDTGQHATPSFTDLPEQLLGDLESILPKLEQQFQALENEQDFSVATLMGFIKNLKPLVEKLLGSLPLDGLDIDTGVEKLEPILEEIFTQAQTINTTQVDLMVDTGLKALVNLCDKYIPTNSPFAPVSEALKKLQLVVSYFIENNLLVAIKVKLLKGNEGLPQPGGMSEEWQEIQAASMTMTPNVMNGNTTAAVLSKKDLTGGTSNTTGKTGQASGTKPSGSTPANTGNIGTEAAQAIQVQTTSGSTTGTAAATANKGTTTAQIPPAANPPEGNGALAVLEKLIQEGMAQLTADQHQWAQDLLSGSAFESLLNTSETIIDNLTPQLEQSAQNIVQAWQENKLNTLVSIINLLIKELKSLVMTLLKTFKTLIDELLKLIGTTLTLLIDLLLHIKLPGNFITSLVPALHKLTTVNVLCLLAATPWDVVIKMKDLDIEMIETWVVG